MVGAVGELRVAYLVKDWIPAGAHLFDRQTEDLAAEQDAMCAAADVVCAVSPRLQAALSARGFDAVLLPHAFHADLAPLYESRSPLEYRRLPRPLLGYAGRIDGRLDFELLRRLADAFPAGSLALIGPVSPRVDGADLRSLMARPNVHLLGTRARRELPPYISGLDCCLLPYRGGEWARHGSPLKLWDYLYAGPPIVGAGYEALTDYPPPLVRFATATEDFIEGTREALAEPGVGREARRSLALENTWDARAGVLADLLSDGVGGRR